MSLILKLDHAKQPFLVISTMLLARNARDLSTEAAMEIQTTLKVYTPVRRTVVVSIWQDGCREVPHSAKLS